MSDKINENLLDRAYEVLEECASHPIGLDKRLSEELNKPHPDLETTRRLVAKLEGALAQEHFHETGQLDREMPDVF